MITMVALGLLATVLVIWWVVLEQGPPVADTYRIAPGRDWPVDCPVCGMEYVVYVTEPVEIQCIECLGTFEVTP